MSDPLRIVIADDDTATLKFLQEILALMGHRVVAAVTDGQQLIEHCRIEQPDLIVTDIKMPDMDGIEATRALYRERPVPVILVSAYHDRELIERAAENHVLAYLVAPLKRVELEAAIALAMQRFSEFEMLRQQTNDLRQALEDRKIIERAKGVLMKRAGLDEEHAFQRLQKLASDKNQKMIEIARMIVTAEMAFHNSPTINSN